MHWAEKYVGRSYLPGEYECPHLVEEVLAGEFGIAVSLPKVDWRKMPPEELEAMCESFARRTETPVEGAGVLMRIKGRKGDIGSHVGLYSAVTSEVWVLHSLRRVGAIFVPAAQLSIYGLELVGFYEWKTR